MEYRGYDSVGIATLNNGKLLIRKGIGKVAEVNASLELKEMIGRIRNRSYKMGHPWRSNRY